MTSTILKLSLIMGYIKKMGAKGVQVLCRQTFNDFSIPPPA